MIPAVLIPLETEITIGEHVERHAFGMTFNIDTIIDRIEEAGDPFKLALLTRQDLHPALEKLS